MHIPSIFDDEPYSKREAWAWILLNADEKGELKISVRKLAATFKWSKAKVERFLTMLHTETLFETLSGTPSGTLLKLASYCINNENKDFNDLTGTPSGTLSETLFETPTPKMGNRDNIDLNNLYINTNKYNKLYPRTREVQDSCQKIREKDELILMLLNRCAVINTIQRDAQSQLVLNWLDAGLTEKEIWSEFETIIAREGEKNGLYYFDKPMKRLIAQKSEKALSEKKFFTLRHKNMASKKNQEIALKLWLETKDPQNPSQPFWKPFEFGPAPDHPDTLISDDILAKYGLKRTEHGKGQKKIDAMADNFDVERDK